MAPRFDQREAKALADILALVVGDNENVAVSALMKLRQRAQADSVTGGGLKNMFAALSAEPASAVRPRPTMPSARRGGPASERELASARETIGELTVKTMELSASLSALRSQAAELTAELISTRNIQAETKRELLRQVGGRRRAWFGGVALGVAFTAALGAGVLGSFPRLTAATERAPGPAVPGSSVPVPLNASNAQVGPAAVNTAWSYTTPAGIRWRFSPSGMPSGQSLIIDLGGGRVATLGAPPDFMRTTEPAQSASVDSVYGELKGR